MNKSHWRDDCMEFHGQVLTGAACHWCPEFDGLPIDETCTEYKHCTCGYLVPYAGPDEGPPSEEVLF